jgi:hypothetical protein
MMPLRVPFALAIILVGAAAAAQQRPIFDPDDFVDPRERVGTLFVSRLVAGGVWNPVDDYRPLDDDRGFVFITNSFYISRYQFDYKHTEFVGTDDAPPLRRCDCPDPIYFPTPPPGNATPDAPSAERKDMLQFAFYREKGSRTGGQPIMLRYRVSWSRQTTETEVRSVTTNEVLERRTAHDQSFGLDADLHFRIAGRDVWGSFLLARTVQSGTIDDRSQTELAYTYRPPGRSLGPVLLRATLTVGGVSGRGATGLNVVNPYFEAFWHHRQTDANFHVVYSPLATRSGAEGWRTTHQIALFVDRALYVKLFGAK